MSEKTKETNINIKNLSENSKKKTTKKSITKDSTNMSSIEFPEKKNKTSTLKEKSTSAKSKKNTRTKGSSSVNSQPRSKTSKKSSSTVSSQTSKKVKATSKKSNTKSNKISEFVSNVEYYDLPYRYNQTIVKILAQTPTSLFVYWDISDEDRENYKKEFGDSFFEITHPVLIIYNDSLNYSFEVNINDFANSWYLKVNDSNCDYRIELGRRPNSNNTELSSNYVYISSSNEIKAPNDHILFDKNQKMIYFKNVKTNDVTAKDATQLSFIQNMGKVYNIYDLYQKIYADEKITGFSNPSSQFK